MLKPNLLVNRVDVGGRGSQRGSPDIVLVVVILRNRLVLLSIARASAEDQNTKDPQHPDKNANARSDNEGDGSALPRSERHERILQATHERRVTMRVVHHVVVVVRTGMNRRGDAHPENGNRLSLGLDMDPLSALGSAPPPSRVASLDVNDGRSAVAASFVGNDLDNTSVVEARVALMMIMLDQGKPECLPESVLSLECLLLEQGSHARALSVLSDLRRTGRAEELGDIGIRVIGVTRWVTETHVRDIERMGIGFLDGVGDDYDPQRACRRCFEQYMVNIHRQIGARCLLTHGGACRQGSNRSS